VCLSLVYLWNTYSVISILDNPTFEPQPTINPNHTISEPNLSEFIVEEDCGEEGEGWNCKVWEGNHSGTKSNVEWWNVQEDGDEGGFEEETEVTKVVDHALLRK